MGRVLFLVSDATLRDLIVDVLPGHEVVVLDSPSEIPGALDQPGWALVLPLSFGGGPREVVAARPRARRCRPCS